LIRRLIADVERGRADPFDHPIAHIALPRQIAPTNPRIVMSQSLKVLSAGAVEGPLRSLVPEFARARGIEVELTFSTVGDLKNRFVAGEAADAIALSMPVLQALERENRFVAGSLVELGHATCGVAVRDGMLMPNIATVDGFRRMLKFAISIAANDPAHGGSSGIYLVDLLKRIGAYDEVAPKLKLQKTGRDVGHAVLTGEAEIGITFTSEFLAIEGLRVVGPFPKEYEYVNAYGAAIPRGGAAEPARALLAFLTSADAKARFRDFGLE
jgi:molybdate transport system substrate-binding protein